MGAVQGCWDAVVFWRIQGKAGNRPQDLAPARTTPEIVPLILETPAIRSSQDTETSFMRRPDNRARICISTVQTSR